MSKQTDKSFFMFSPLAAKHSGFYQELLQGIGSYQQLGIKLIQLAEQAHAFRQFDRLTEYAQILINLPIKEYRHIGLYYLAVSLHQNGKGNMERARIALEQVADKIHSDYRARVILLLAAISTRKRDFDSEFYYHIESLKVSNSITTKAIACRGIAIHKARAGDHKHAIKDLERILPLIKYAPPHVYFDYLNSYAVELGEVGHKDEARNIMRVVLASPFISAYPEWQETANELKEANRSFVAVSAIEEEHAEPVGYLEPEPQARVYLFPHRKEEAPQLPIPEPITNDQLDGMSLPELKAMLLSLIYDKDTTQDDYRRMLMASSLIKQEEWPKQIDLESESNLEEIILHWLHEETSPEQLTAVFSALRDCNSEYRRTSIIDRIISIAYKESMSGQTTESEWRERFEAKLTPNPYTIE